jgi:hypothetical protein
MLSQPEPHHAANAEPEDSDLVSTQPMAPAVLVSVVNILALHIDTPGLQLVTAWGQRTAQVEAWTSV